MERFKKVYQQGVVDVIEICEQLKHTDLSAVG